METIYPVRANSSIVIACYSLSVTMSCFSRRLELRMVTLWVKTNQLEFVHELDEAATLRLHPAAHNSLSPRLLSVLKVDEAERWDMCCLSDFICARKSIANE